MRKSKSYKYKNYGPIPQNEYSTVNLGKSSDTASVLGVVPQAVDAAHRQSLIKQQARHPSGRRKSWGWSHSWKTNGWRAESAALHDEGSYMEGDSTYL